MLRPSVRATGKRSSNGSELRAGHAEQAQRKFADKRRWLILLSETVRRRHAGLHRLLGRVQVVVLLLFVLPSSAVMSQHAFGGWLAGLSFLLLSALTAICAIIGVVHARRRRYDRHRRWMLRSYVLICSAVALRLISGTAGLVGVPSPEGAYIFAAWSSWLFPLAAYEFVERLYRPSRQRHVGRLQLTAPTPQSPPTAVPGH